MNNTNSTDTSESIELILWFSRFFGNYGVISISFIGILVNSFMLYLLSSKILTNPFYKYIKLKAFIDTIVCLLGVFHHNNVCVKCRHYTYSHIYIVLRIGHVIANRFILLASSLHEIYLITNRYMILKNRNNWIINIKVRYYFPTVILVCIMLVIPYFFIFEIKYEEIYQNYYWVWTDSFMNSKYFKGLIFLLGFTENVVPLICLVTLIILCQIQYKKRIQIKSKITIQSIKNLKKLENSYIRITLIQTVMYIISKLSDFLSSSLLRVVFFLDIEFSELTLSLIDFSRQFAFFLLNGLHSFDQLLYIQIDQNLRRVARDLFTKIKVIYKLSKINNDLLKLILK